VLSYEALEHRAAEQGNALPHSSLNRLLAKAIETRMPDDVLAAFMLADGTLHGCRPSARGRAR
jgi:hypothetical protein